MKTTEQIKERIDALELRQKDWLDLRVEIYSLIDCLDQYRDTVRDILIDSIEAWDYKWCRELLWVLED